MQPLSQPVLDRLAFPSSNFPASDKATMFETWRGMTDAERLLVATEGEAARGEVIARWQASDARWGQVLLIEGAVAVGGILLVAWAAYVTGRRRGARSSHPRT